MSAWSWDNASEFVASKGFTEHFCLGNCNGAGLGSKHVFVKPDATEKSIRDLHEYATLSYSEGKWCVSIHEQTPRRRASLSIAGGTDYGD